MAYAMTKRGSQDNCITYEFVCDTLTDMNAIENKYRTIGSIAIVLEGDSGGLEVYITGSNKQWNALNGGATTTNTPGGLEIYICTSEEVDQLTGLPDIDEPDETTLYLVPASEDSGNLYDEYIYVNNAWEFFAGARIDLSTYAPKDSPVFTGTISMGRAANSTVGTNSIAIGGNVIASGTFSHAEGADTTASGVQAHAEGASTTASGVQSHAEGNGTKAIGLFSHAEGLGGTYTKDNITYTSEAAGQSDHTEGYQTRTASSQPGNHAEGFQTSAIGGASHAEGNVTTASGVASHAEGYSTIASGTYSHAEGINSGAVGVSSHAEGNSTKAYGQESHVEGVLTVASNKDSHAEGDHTIACGYAEHVSGCYNVSHTIPNWTASTSYAVGDIVTKTVVFSDGVGYSVIYKCKTANSDNTFNLSKWIEWGQYLVIVGNGTSSARSNAYALDWAGNERIMGDLYIGCNADSSGGSAIGARIAALEAQVASLSNAIIALTTPENTITADDGSILTDESNEILGTDDSVI